MPLTRRFLLRRSHYEPCASTLLLCRCCAVAPSQCWAPCGDGQLRHAAKQGAYSCSATASLHSELKYSLNESKSGKVHAEVSVKAELNSRMCLYACEKPGVLHTAHGPRQPPGAHTFREPPPLAQRRYVASCCAAQACMGLPTALPHQEGVAQSIHCGCGCGGFFSANGPLLAALGRLEPARSLRGGGGSPGCSSPGTATG